MTFDQWWAANWPRIKHEATISEAQYMSCLAAFQACWNGALGAATERMLICCCGHSRGEHNSELGACQHENCTCIQVCDCWVIVTEAREEEHPRILEEAFQKLKA